MTIQQLEYILEVNRVGTITQAAKNLIVSHSSVSNAIRALEEELGFAIFDRSWQGAAPTQRGAKVLEHARQICEHQELILQTAQEVRCVCIETGRNVLFSDMFVRLMDEYRGREDVVFRHRHNRSADERSVKSPEDRLLEFETDLFVDTIQGEGSRLLLHKRTAYQKKLTLEVRATLPAVVRIGLGHPLYQKPDIQLSDFAQDCLVDTPRALLANSGMIGRKLGFRPARTLLAAEGKTRYELVAAGHGYSFGSQLPDYLNRQYGFRSIPVPNFQYYLIAMTNPVRPIPPEAQRYLELLDEQFAPIRID